MIAFPNCKINLGLNILSKREDNFHNLETVFFPISFTDILEILPSGNNSHLKVSGFATGKTKDNLCMKAFNLIRKDYTQMPDVTMRLHKAIPIGAGLGGGSADAAFTLQLLNKKFNLNISEKKLLEYALELGSDCSFFLVNKPCLATGRGEIIKSIDLSLSGKKILLINPGIHINTSEAFKEIKPFEPTKRIEEIINQPIETWKPELKNDFEDPVFKKYPTIKTIKQRLYDAGAIYAAMSGSGSTVYGIFYSDTPNKYSHEPGYFHKLLDMA